MIKPRKPVQRTAKRRARAEEMLRYVLGDSALGPLLVASSAKGVTAILIEQEAEHLLPKLRRRFPAAHLIDDPRGQAGVLKRIVKFIADPVRGLDVPLDIRGTPFQKKVFRAICEIPPGQTASYSDIAHRIGAPRAARAVGTVCASTCLAIAVPCHRVLHKDGSPLEGPHWGGNRQLMLIAREQTVARRPGKRRR